MYRITASILTIIVLLCGIADESSAVSQERVPFTINDDFETGEMFAWEAYPYAQDIGYEPFTVTRMEPTHNNSKFSLAKIHRTNDIVEIYQGFTKEIDLWTVSNTRMKLALFFIADRNPEYVELSLCLFDGSRYFHRVDAPEANRWHELNVQLNSFTANGNSLAAGEHVQAITIMGFYPDVSHIPSYTICLDDFSLNGERQRRFTALTPTSTDYEMFGYSVLNQHYYYGDSINITVEAEKASQKSPLKTVTCDIIDPAGKTVKSGIKLRESNGKWTAPKAYSFRKKDPRGQWRIELSGDDGSGNKTDWGFRFLMPGTRLTSAVHPRIFFTKEELAAKMASQSKREEEMIDDFVRNADYFKNIDISGIEENDTLSDIALTGHQFTKINFSGGWRTEIGRLSSIAEQGALRYAFTGDEESGRVACDALLKLCSFKRWNHPWQLARGNHTYYPMGYTTGQAGVAYDHLYHLLTEQERKAVREAIMDKGIKMFYRDMVEMNRMPSSVTNHIAVIVANLTIAGTAIYGDDPDDSNLEPYFSGILAKMKRFIDRTYYPDGSYGEPFGYENMATRDIVEALFVLERNFGIDYTTTTNIQNLYLLPLHGAYNDGKMPGYGDVHIGGRWSWTGHPFLWLTYRMKNPWTAHYIQPDLQEGRGSLFEYLWHTTGLEAKSREELTASHLFPVKGTMFMRSGWEDEGTILSYKGGPNSNHYHLDQGSLILMTNGELLLSEAGLESIRGFHAYYANPYYPAYDTQAMGHNVLIVDGDPESQMPGDYENGIKALRNWPQIRHSFVGMNVDEIEGELSSVYKNKLSEYTRSIMYVKPDIFVLYDRVKSPDEHFFSWIFHAEDNDGKRSISQKESRIMIERPNARLDMDVLTPVASSRIRPAIHHETLIQITGERGVTEDEFMAVMVPRAVESIKSTPTEFTSELLTYSGWKGAKIEKDGLTTQVLFRNGPRGQSTAAGYTTDAERFTVTTNSQGKVIGLFLRGMTLKGHNEVFTATSPVSASVAYKSGRTELEMDAPSNVEVSLSMQSRPSTVTVNGEADNNWSYDTGTRTMKITLPAGHAVMKAQ